MSEQKRQLLVAQNEALYRYLDSLLAEIPTASDDNPAERSQVALAETVSDVVTAPPDIADDLDVEPQTETMHEVAVVANAVEEPSASITAAPIAEPTAVRPTTEFKCLLFTVGGMSLAAPLDKLNGILVLEDKVTPIPESSPLLLGLYHHRDTNIKVVDTVRFIHGDKPQPADGEIDPESRRIVLLDEGRIGLSCDSVHGMITVDPDNVRWRNGRTRQPWYDGIITDHMCALLDVDRLIASLASL